MTATGYPILRSLDPYHARIGYLGALASVATRGLDRTDALTVRFCDVLYERIGRNDDRYAVLMERIPTSRRDEFGQRLVRPEADDPSGAPLSQMAEAPPADWPLVAPPKRSQPRLVRTDWHYVSEFWLYDRVMPASLGHLPRDKANRTIELARWTNVILPTLELSETGYLIQHLLQIAQKSTGQPAFNLLNPTAHPCLPMLYFHVILEHEMLLPFLLLELAEWDGRQPTTRGSDGVLIRTVRRMLDAIGDTKDPENALAVRSIDEFHKSIARKDSTQENYLRPRLENLVDLGLMHRLDDRQKFMWSITDATVRAAKLLSPLAARHNRTTQFLDERLFGVWANIFDEDKQRVGALVDRLRWFALAFKAIGREFGFTPGRTLALKACVLAWEAGYLLEVKDVFDAVYEAAKGPWSQYLRFSGGSRFDAEFLIRVDDAMLPALLVNNPLAGSTP
ncbi:MAG: hypothetical protein AB2A00_04385 [Myxococcota bacterium]